ncbi:MAG: glycosyltransferase [Ferruginibacter sp.]
MSNPKILSEYHFEQAPIISVLLPVYNGGEYLKKSLQSVLAQNFLNFELLIIEDCSTDKSLEYLQSIKDSRITLFENKTNRGLFYNLNFLIEKANTSLLKLWAQDDIMYPECLGSFVEFHRINPDIGFSYSGRDIIDENGDIIEINKIDNTPTIISTALHARIAYYTGSIAGNIANVCINRNALNEVGLFKEHMKISADFDMWVRLAKDHNTGFIREKLIQLRDHDKQLSRNEKYYINHVREDLEVYRYLDNYVTPEQKNEGHKLMRNNKLLFYCTLMFKSFLKGEFLLAFKYYQLLANYENFLMLIFAFTKTKIMGKKEPDFKILINE